MNKTFFIYAFLSCAFLSCSAFGLGVGVDAVQARPLEPKSTAVIQTLKYGLNEYKEQSKQLQDFSDAVRKAITSVKSGGADKASIAAPSKFGSIKLNDKLEKLDLQTLENTLAQVEYALAETKAQENELNNALESEEGNQSQGEVVVDPQISAGEGDPTATINLRYTYYFDEKMFLTSAIDIGATPNDTADKLAAGFAMNGGNVDFSLRYGYRFEYIGRSGLISFIPSLSYTYSGMTASELDLQSGGTTEVDTEVQSATLNLTVAFGKQYFLALDHSYHDVSEREASEFSALLDQKRTTVVRAIFAMDEEAKRLLVLERAHPVGNESAQLRISFITSLAF